jgi:uncharacterized membrane protein
MSEQRQERASPERGPSIAFGIFAGLLLLARLLRLSAEGLSASFDSAIYIRNLWGIAQGDWHNPLVNDHIFGVHGNWVLLLLAPLVRFADPALLLTLSQGLALGATAGLLHYGFLEALGQRASRGRRLAAATLLSAGLLAGPVAINPFLFDLRPDMLGLPLLLAGLLRARRQGFDGAALAWMGAALFVREDFGMVIIGAMATAPFGRSLLSNWQRRCGVIAAALAFFAIYWFGVRSWVAPQSVARASSIASQMLDNASPLPVSQVIAYKAEILAAVLLGGGLLPLFGWRWLGVAMPGLAFLLIQSRMQADLLDFHYAIFALPGLAIASVDGLERLVARPRHAPLLLISAVCMGTLFATSSALPGGGRHFASREAARNDDGSLRLTADGLPLYEAMNAMVAALPASDGVAVPFALSAGAASRSTIVTTEQVKQWVSKGEKFPPDLHWVVLFGKDFEGLGSRLVSEHGLHLVTTVDQSLAVLTDRPVPTNWEAFSLAATGCAPWAEWPTAGVRLCTPDARRPGWWVERTAGATLPAPTDLFLEPAGAAPVLFRGVSGLVALSSLPVGRALPVRGADGSGVSFSAAVLAAQGRAISCRSTDGSSGLRCNLRSMPPTPPAQGKDP